MFEECEPIEQRLVKAILKNERKPEFILMGTSLGFEVFIRHGNKLYQLYTQRKSPRVFRSPNTAINFLADLGAGRIVIDGLDNWKSDIYVNQNSRPKGNSTKNKKERR